MIINERVADSCHCNATRNGNPEHVVTACVNACHISIAYCNDRNSGRLEETRDANF
jgi:hypothetical protein